TEIVQMTDLTFGKATFEPGWRWTESVKDVAGHRPVRGGPQGIHRRGPAAHPHARRLRGGGRPRGRLQGLPGPRRLGRRGRARGGARLRRRRRGGRQDLTVLTGTDSGRKVRGPDGPGTLHAA